MSKVPLPEHIAAVVKRETAGELIRWSGQPDAGYAAKWSMLVWIFAVPWTAFSAMMALQISGLGKLFAGAASPWGAFTSVVGLLFMVPFLLIGFGMLLAPLWVLRKARATAWVVTDKRLLTIEVHGRHTKVKSVLPERIVSIERTERADGSGSLKLLLGSRRDSDGDMVSETEAITAVPDVRRLEQLLTAFRPQPAGTAQA